MPEIGTQAVIDHSDKNIQQKQMDIVTGFVRKLRNGTTDLRTPPNGGHFLYLKAINGRAVFAALTYSDGAVLTAGDVLEVGDYQEGPIRSYQLSEGVVIEHYL